MVEKQSVWGCPEFSSEKKKGDFSGGPVVKISPSNIGGVCSIPGWEVKIPHPSSPKKTKHKIEVILQQIP